MMELCLCGKMSLFLGNSCSSTLKLKWTDISGEREKDRERNSTDEVEC